ncbi:MAG: two-component system sensor histidine kinase CreC [Ramlibacter sp.]|nr:two-component system sensor histidine kinase CreC [Ramlibacter sp.]
MGRRNRIFIGVLLIYIAGMAFMLYRVVADIDPRYRESAEESLVETSHLLASLIEMDVVDGVIDTPRLQQLFRTLYARPFSAQIFSLNKTRVELRVYVTDSRGYVMFDSLGRHEDEDFSRWRDVSETLRGRYGARTSRDVEGDPLTSVMYVGAPITTDHGIIGVVSVGKPVQSFGQFVDAARENTIKVGLYSALAVLVLAIIMSLWLVRPFGLVADYTRWVRRQTSFSPARMLRRAASQLRGAYNEMRDAVAGRNYVADYVQTLTHEVKSPLSAIRGAAELLQEPMPDAQRQHFVGNIARETRRIQELVDRMMELTALENRRTLDNAQPVALRALLEDVADSASAAASARQVSVTVQGTGDAVVEGDAFLLHRALSNLVDNAVDFSPAGSTIELALQRHRRTVLVTVRDHGPGIPDYAQEKVFEKFYSLARPDSRKKSTGLGLAFVREIAALHDGRVELGNAPEGGAIATLSLPLADGLHARKDPT